MRCMKRKPRKIDGMFAYRAVIEYARKQTIDDPHIKLRFGILRQMIQDIATEHDYEILESAFDLLKSDRLQDLCDTLGIDRQWLLEQFYATMKSDIEEALAIMASRLPCELEDKRKATLRAARRSGS